MAQHNELGKQGEQKAVAYLQSIGYEILATNWRYEKCELDIVCAFHELIVFVEVKTRSGTYFGKPAEFIDAAKQDKLIEGAEAFLEEQNIDKEIRFDIIEVIAQKSDFKLNHLIDAFRDGL